MYLKSIHLNKTLLLSFIELIDCIRHTIIKTQSPGHKIMTVILLEPFLVDISFIFICLSYLKFLHTFTGLDVLVK